MRGTHGFLIKPKGDRYNNTKKVGDKELILNSEISNHQFTNREAIVLETPIINNTGISKGDTVIVHHNVFRRWTDVRGEEKNSKNYFTEDKYVVYEDQIFLYKNTKWNSMPGFCFVQPIKNLGKFDIDQEEPLKGIVVHTDGSVAKEELVGFTPSSQYEFVFEEQRLYRVYSKFITIKYERKGNEEKYNPSWT
mgnify:CR=1 FL=1|tara:strand:+ start:28 stop:606 length:579 start_codon:yes stop_codon:yes gene_type:complete